MIVGTSGRRAFAAFGSNHRDTLWIFAERIAGSILNFLAVLAVMRLLGPTVYGEWAFSFSIVSLLLVSGNLGLDGLAMRKLIELPHKTKELLGVITVLRYAVYFLVISGTLLVFSLSYNVTTTELHILYILVPVVLAAPLTASILAWANSQSYFSDTARWRILVLMIGSVAKIALVFAGFGIVEFSIAHSAMFSLEAAVLLSVLALKRGPLPWEWKFENDIAFILLRQSVFLFAATLFATLYFTLDVIILRVYRGTFEVGMYAVVPQILFATQLIPYAVTLSQFPSLTKTAATQTQEADFRVHVSKLLVTLIVLSIAACAAVAVFNSIFFDMIFGDAYREAKGYLWIACLAITPIFIRQLTTKLYILQDSGRVLASIEFVGLVIVTILLFVFVPIYGGYAAIASVVIGVWTTVVLSLSQLGLLTYQKKPSRRSV